MQFCFIDSTSQVFYKFILGTLYTIFANRTNLSVEKSGMMYIINLLTLVINKMAGFHD